MFVDELYNAGIIDQRLFSFYIAPYYDRSIVTFGGYNLDYANQLSNRTVTWNDLVNTHYWSLNLVGVKLGDRQIPISTNQIMVDTGTSYLLMPQGKLIRASDDEL